MTVPGAGQPPAGAFAVDDPKKPALNVMRTLRALFPHDERPRLIYYRENFYEWTGTHWTVIDVKTLSAMVNDQFKNAMFVQMVGGRANGVPTWVDFDINTAKRKELVDGLQHETLIDRMVTAPTWLNGRVPYDNPELPANEMIACGNYLVHAGSRRAYAHTPNLLNHFSVDYDYDPHAAAPDNWLRFLNEIWPSDQESIDTLQEIFGYLLTRRTDLQKMFMMIGPPRSGKGTIIRVLTAMLGGGQNVTSISMANLNERFGLAEVLDRTLAIMQDARFRSRDDGTAVERILSITGEDPVSVDRKGKDLLTVRLPVRFLLVSNELPKMQDESGALRTRMLMLRLRKTVAEEQRDNRLTEKLIAELPAILNWALDGLARLGTRGQFSQPKSAEEDLDLMADLSSPTKAFLDDCCVINGAGTVTKADLWQAWQIWCQKTNTFVGNDRSFAKNLYATTSDVRSTKPRVNGAQVPHYEGIALSSDGLDMMRAFGATSWPGMVS